MGYIYKITNQINGKIYIGQTRKTLQERMNAHIKKASEYPNRYLYDAMNHYGYSNFSIALIEECSNSQLDEREIYWINYYDSTNHEIGYNLTSGGGGGNTWLLNPHKLQTGEKIRKSNLKEDYIPITKESLESDINNGLTSEEMMKKYHTSSVTLANRIRLFFDGKTLKEIRPVKNSGQFKPIEISKDEFYKDIKDNVLTNKEIAKKYNISETTLFNKCKKYFNATPNQIRGIKYKK